MGTGFESLAHKPRLQAFEYMIDQLGCDPADLLHVSSRLRYDHMSAYDVGIRHTAYIERGHGPSHRLLYTTQGNGIPLPCYAISSSQALASRRSSVSNPSVNQP